MPEDFAIGWRWEHCSPALLNEGISCGLQPRRACQCPTGGSHDHLVQRGWASELDEEFQRYAPGNPPTQEEMAEGHLFEISIRSWGVSSVVGDPERTQADWTLPPHPVHVRAWSLKEALWQAVELPLEAWFPGGDDDD